MALVCVAFSALFLALVGGQQTRMAQDRITAGWERILPMIKQEGLPAVLPQSKAVKGQEIQVLNAANLVIAATPNLVGRPPMATLRPGDSVVRNDRKVCHPAGLKDCMTVALFKVYSQPGGIWTLEIASPAVPWYSSSTTLFLTLGASLVIIVIAAALAFRAVGKDLAPVEAIRAELADITADGLHRRVPIPNGQHQLKDLAETVNVTLDRLEDAYQKLRRFTADASHDLRSPIAALRARVEEALMYPDDSDWPQTAMALLADIERLQAIVTDLLTLARLDASTPLTREVTDLGRLVDAELNQRTSPRQIVRMLQPNVVIHADRLPITRLLVNLLDNAERHATAQITVNVRAEESTAVLEVIDDGPGIPAEQREIVFDRFTRLDSARNRDAGGTGLGLAIARQIAEAHHGTLTIQDSPRGARFVLRIPVYDRLDTVETRWREEPCHLL